MPDRSETRLEKSNLVVTTSSAHATMLPPPYTATCHLEAPSSTGTSITDSAMADSAPGQESVAFRWLYGIEYVSSMGTIIFNLWICILLLKGDSRYSMSMPLYMCASVLDLFGVQVCQILRGAKEPRNRSIFAPSTGCQMFSLYRLLFGCIAAASMATHLIHYMPPYISATTFAVLMLFPPLPIIFVGLLLERRTGFLRRGLRRIRVHLGLTPVEHSGWKKDLEQSSKPVSAVETRWNEK